MKSTFHPATKRDHVRLNCQVGQITDVALLSRNRKDFTARFDSYALAGGRKRHVRQAVRHVFPARHHPGKVTSGRDVDDVLLTGSWIELMNITGLFEDDRAGA